MQVCRVFATRADERMIGRTLKPFARDAMLDAAANSVPR
jgi:hypothetical protein